MRNTVSMTCVAPTISALLALPAPAQSIGSPIPEITGDLKSAPVNFATMVTSDHGQHDIPDPVPGGKHGGHGGDSDQGCLVPCTLV